MTKPILPRDGAMEHLKTETAKDPELPEPVYRRTVPLTAEACDILDTAIPDLIELLSDVRNVFWDLSYTDDLDKPAVNSILRLAGRAVESMENVEIRALAELDKSIRHAPRVGR